MSQEIIPSIDEDEKQPWKRIAGRETKAYELRELQSSGTTGAFSLEAIFRRFIMAIRDSCFKLFLQLVHYVARAVNKPVVDIGREHSVSALNDRINTLEDILIRQWSQLKDEDFLSPNDEIRQYVAACHVARQYERITSQLLSRRLGISQNKAEILIEQLVDDEVITESYTVSYHDVRRSMIEPVIERKLSGVKHATSVKSSTKGTSKH